VTDPSVPALDDLRFQDLVDGAKRYLPQRAPAWTDHNVSDPGITLVEACATRVDHLGYRTDQVPDAVRAALLRLAGVVPSPPSGARVDLTFTLADPAGADRAVPAGSQVTTRPGGASPVIAFRTLADLAIPAGQTAGTVAAANTLTVREDLGAATGTPGQRVAPSRTPLLTAQADGTSAASLTLTVVDPDQSAAAWRQVPTFAEANAADTCFVWDATARQVVLGPLTPYASGALQHGAVPVAGARLVVEYQTTQGSVGNIPARSSLTWDRAATMTVTNAAAASGGADAEAAADAIARTVADLAPLERAVCGDDYTRILTRGVPGLARVRTVPFPGLATDPADNGYLQVTVAQKFTGDPRQKLPDDLRLSADTARAAGACVESARLLCARVRVAEPDWTRFSVTATVRSWSSGDSPAAVQGRQATAQALFAFFHPTTGGPDGRGWPFGRPIHAGDAYAVVAALPQTINVVELTVTDQAGYATSRIGLPANGLPALVEANISFVTSDQDRFQRVPQGMWGLFDAADGRGRLLGLFHSDAANLDTGIGATAKSLVNATSSTLQAFSQPTKNMTTLTVYPGTVCNLAFASNQKLTSATVYTAVPDGTFCLFEHPGRAGKQWIFWPADAPIDLARAGVGAAQSVSSVVNSTTRTVDLRQDSAQSGPGQLFQPGVAADVLAGLDNKLRYATLLNGPRAGQYCLYGAVGQSGTQWVFDASVSSLADFLGAGGAALSVSNQTANSLALFGRPGFMSGTAGVQPVAPRTTAPVRAGLAGSAASVQCRPVGSVFGWGSATTPLSDIPSGLTDVFAVAAGAGHSLALKADGSVVAWGANDSGQTSVPAGLTATAIAAGATHSLALAADGSVAAWGANDSGQTTVPAGLTATAIAAGTGFSLALRPDGTVAAWGANQNQPPAGLSGVTALAAGPQHCLALAADGSVTAWGANDSGQTTVPAGLAAIGIAAGAKHSLALKADGSVVAWGANDGGQTTIPAGLSAVAVAAGSVRSMALTADGTVVAWGGGTGAGQAFAVLPVTNARTIAMAVGDAQSLSVAVTN
jgi:hypothetical protein